MLQPALQLFSRVRYLKAKEWKGIWWRRSLEGEEAAVETKCRMKGERTSTGRVVSIGRRKGT